MVVTIKKGVFQIAVKGDETNAKTIKANCIAITKSFGSRGFFTQVPKNKDGSESVILKYEDFNGNSINKYDDDWVSSEG